MEDGGQLVGSGVNAVAEFAQGLEERGLGTFVHPGNAAEAEAALAEADHGGKKARGGAGIADEEFKRFVRRAGVWNAPAESVDGDGAVAVFGRVGLDLHLETQMGQAFRHDLRVLAPERAAQRGHAVGQRREDEGAVGDALGAGHGDLRRDGRGERDDLDQVGKGHGRK